MTKEPAYKAAPLCKALVPGSRVQPEYKIEDMQRSTILEMVDVFLRDRKTRSIMQIKTTEHGWALLFSVNNIF